MNFKELKVSIILSILLIVISLIAIFSAQIENLAFSFQGLLEGKIWTLFTATFITGAFLPIMLSLFFLWVFSFYQERKIGSLHTLIIFLAGQIIGFLIFGIIFRDKLIIGPASGVAALLGSLLITNREAIKKSLFLKIVVIYSIIALILGPFLTALMGTGFAFSYIGRYAGLVSGLLYGWVINKRK